MSDAAKMFGHYEVERVLGRGAMGTVYLARDTRIGRRVALKTVKMDSARFEDDSEANEFYLRLQREAELGGSLQHPNIVTLYEPGYEDGRIAWLATEYIDGEPLRDLIRRELRPPLQRVFEIAEDLLLGLAYAHAHGVIHRDIKPANILLSMGGDAKIADFGIARANNSTLTHAGSMLGTPSYMSPEQVRGGTVTPRSDLFSFGALLYELLTGMKAFGAPDIGAILRNVVEYMPPEPRTINSEVPVELNAMVMKLLAKQPADRFESADEALEALVAAQHGEPPPPPPPLPPAEEIETIASDPRRFGLDLADTQPTRDRGNSLLTRRVPAWIVAMVLILFAASMVAGYVALHESIDSGPVDIAASDREAALRNKKLLLDRARSLAARGDLGESIAAYEQFIGRYPQSVVARDENELVKKRLGSPKESEAKPVEVRARKTVTEKPKPKRPGFRERLKRFFTRG